MLDELRSLTKEIYEDLCKRLDLGINPFFELPKIEIKEGLNITAEYDIKENIIRVEKSYLDSCSQKKDENGIKRTITHELVHSLRRYHVFYGISNIETEELIATYIANLYVGRSKIKIVECIKVCEKNIEKRKRKNENIKNLVGYRDGLFVLLSIYEKPEEKKWDLAKKLIRETNAMRIEKELKPLLKIGESTYNQYIKNLNGKTLLAYS